MGATQGKRHVNVLSISGIANLSPFLTNTSKGDSWANLDLDEVMTLGLLWGNLYPCSLFQIPEMIPCLQYGSVLTINRKYGREAGRVWEGGGAEESEVQTEGSHGEGGETSPSKQA